MPAALRAPVLALALVAERVRHVPVLRRLGFLVPWLVAGLVVAAAIAFVAWFSTPSPQRVTLGDLPAGAVSQLQTWIIVEGDMAKVESPNPDDHLYKLTDPHFPNVWLTVFSDHDLPTGHLVLSGHLIGSRPLAKPGEVWSTRMEADDTLATELPPPWQSAVLLVAAFLVFAGRRTTYPMFFRERPADVAPREGPIAVTVRQLSARTDEPETVGMRTVTPAVLDLSASRASRLTIRGGREVSVLLHSSATGADVGALRGFSTFEPALRVRPSAEDVIVSFASRPDRDRAYATLVAAATMIVRGGRRALA